MKELYEKILKFLESETKEEMIISAKRVHEQKLLAKKDIDFSEDAQDIEGVKFSEALVKIVRG